MSNQQAAVAAKEAQLAVEQAKVPYFHVEPKKDQFTGVQGLEQFKNSLEDGQWNDKRTKSYFYNAMRGDNLRRQVLDAVHG